MCSCQRTSPGPKSQGVLRPETSSPIKMMHHFPRSLFSPISNLKSLRMVGLTGLEPVTLRLSSACSNQLSYRPMSRLRRKIFEYLLPILDLEQLARFARIYLNRQSQIANRKYNGGKGITLPLVHPKLCPDCGFCLHAFQALEARGFEPLTSSLQSWRSTN